MRLLLLLLLSLLLAAASANLPTDADEASVESAFGADNIVSVETVKQEDDVVYITPDAHQDAYFAEHFDSEESFNKKWIQSQAKKDGAEEALAKYDGEWLQEQQIKDPLAGDYGLVLKSKAKHAAISAKLKKPFKFEEKQFIVQYELNFQNGQDCGGGYIKLLSASPDLDLRQFTDQTPYSIMFGPDKCGSDAKLHFIFKHINPKNKTVEEKHCKKLETKERSMFEEMFKDKRPHLYRLVIRPDNTYETTIDYKIVSHGSLLEDFTPAVNPPMQIDDPKDRKPEDWDEREKIPDPAASKPEDWDEDEPRTIVDAGASMPDGWLEDEPEMLPDPTAERPDDWDNDMDGEWEAPLVENPVCTDAPGCGKWTNPTIDNPRYKGKWYPALINNPNYKGKWKPAKIDNPEYFHDPEPFKMAAIGAVGIELWSMSDDIYFDNLLITDDLNIAQEWATNSFDLKVQKLDVNDAGLFRRILTYSNRNPWLYAVYVVVVGLPLVLIITFCCSGESAKSDGSGKNQLNDPKKTDEDQDDDQEGEEEEEEEEPEEEPEEEEDEPPQTRTSARKRRARKD